MWTGYFYHPKFGGKKLYYGTNENCL